MAKSTDELLRDAHGGTRVTAARKDAAWDELRARGVDPFAAASEYRRGGAA